MVTLGTVLLELVAGVGIVVICVYYAAKQRKAKAQKEEPTSSQ